MGPQGPLLVREGRPRRANLHLLDVVGPGAALASRANGGTLAKVNWN